MALSPAEERFRILRTILVCLSLANLFFISAWYRIQDLQAPFANYFRDRPPDLTILKATVLDALLLTAVFAVLSWIAGWLPQWEKLWDCIFLAAVALALEVTRAGWPNLTWADEARRVGALVAEVALVGGLLLRAFSNRRVAVTAVTRVLLFFNFLFLALAVHFVSAWIATPADAEFYNQPSAASAGKAGPRVLWLLFDSLDMRMTFDARHPSLQLPELDRLRNASFSAAQGYSPARYTTYSVPGLLTGRLFQESSPSGPDLNLLTPRGGGEPISWTSMPSLFYDTRKLGLNARVTGWYHPYCRLFGTDLVDCLNELGVDSRATQESYAASLGIAGSMKYLMRQRFENLLFRLHIRDSRPSDILPQIYAQKRQREQYLAIRQHTIETIPRFTSGLYYVHWPLPHPPAIYDRRTKSFESTLANTYLDNLALVDRTLGELRVAMEKAGIWENTTIIVTADHGYRPEIWSGSSGDAKEMIEALGGSKSLTVPVIIRFAGHAEPLKYGPTFNNVLLHDIVLAIFQNQLTNSAQLSKWLDANKDRFPTAPPQPIP
ncbi:MAG: sulfatase-like hydrolase/transferase [Bryobacteraceae bacterium]